MKLTVGPLAPAVYWRRRAIVAGVLLLGVVVIAYSCSGGDPSRANAGRRTDLPASVSISPASSPTATTPLRPTIGSPLPSASSSTQPGTGGPVAGGPAGAGPCTDAEMSVVAAPETAKVRQGVALKITLKIKSLATRPCTRDVGANAQELYIVQGATKMWSSDACDALTGTEIRTFSPGEEMQPYVVWTGRATSQGCANRPWAPIGTYQIYGRLASKLSDPVPIEITV
jgi:hypothetical protein